MTMAGSHASKSQEVAQPSVIAVVDAICVHESELRLKIMHSVQMCFVHSCLHSRSIDYISERQKAELLPT